MVSGKLTQRRSEFHTTPGEPGRLEETAEHGQSGLAPMLPAPLQFIVAMIAYAINQRMARQLDYLQEEVRVLKEALAAATGKTRIDFSAEQRRRLAHKGKELTAEERQACCQVVRPATILAWFRQLAAQSTTARRFARRAGRANQPKSAHSCSIRRVTIPAGDTRRSAMRCAD